MKEFLRFLMCVIIVAVLIFVYTFLRDQNNIYNGNANNISGDVIERISGDNEKSDLSGEYENVESGEQNSSGDVDDSASGDEDKKDENHQDVEKISGDASVKNIDENNTKVDERNNESGNLSSVSGD